MGNAGFIIMSSALVLISRPRTLSIPKATQFKAETNPASHCKEHDGTGPLFPYSDGKGNDFNISLRVEVGQCKGCQGF